MGPEPPCGVEEVVELRTGVDEVVELPRSLDVVELPRSVDVVELLAGVDEVVELLAGVDEVVVGADWPVPELSEHAGTAKSAVTATAVSRPRKILIRSGLLFPPAFFVRWTTDDRP